MDDIERHKELMNLFKKQNDIQKQAEAVKRKKESFAEHKAAMDQYMQVKENADRLAREVREGIAMSQKARRGVRQHGVHGIPEGYVPVPNHDAKYGVSHLEPSKINSYNTVSGLGYTNVKVDDLRNEYGNNPWADQDLKNMIDIYKEFIKGKESGEKEEENNKKIIAEQKLEIARLKKEVSGLNDAIKQLNEIISQQGE